MAQLTNWQLARRLRADGLYEIETDDVEDRVTLIYTGPEEKHRGEREDFTKSVWDAEEQRWLDDRVLVRIAHRLPVLLGKAIAALSPDQQAAKWAAAEDRNRWKLEIDEAHDEVGRADRRRTVRA